MCMCMSEFVLYYISTLAFIGYILHLYVNKYQPKIKEFAQWKATVETRLEKLSAIGMYKRPTI